MDSMETNTCLQVGARGQRFPPPPPEEGLWVCSLEALPQDGSCPTGAHVARMGSAMSSLTGGQSRPQSGRAAHPGHQPQGDGAALLCPAEGLPGTELPELECGHLSPAGRPRSAWSAGWEQERDRKASPRGTGLQQQGLIQVTRGERP